MYLDSKALHTDSIWPVLQMKSDVSKRDSKEGVQHLQSGCRSWIPTTRQMISQLIVMNAKTNRAGYSRPPHRLVRLELYTRTLVCKPPIQKVTIRTRRAISASRKANHDTGSKQKSRRQALAAGRLPRRDERSSWRWETDTKSPTSWRYVCAVLIFAIHLVGNAEKTAQTNVSATVIPNVFPFVAT